MAAIVLHDGSRHMPSTFDLQGGTASVDLLPDGPQKAAANTAVDIIVPAYVNCVGRLRASYTYV